MAFEKTGRVGLGDNAQPDDEPVVPAPTPEPETESDTNGN